MPAGVTLGVGGALTAAGTPFFSPTNGTVFKKKTYPVIPEYVCSILGLLGRLQNGLSSSVILTKE